MSGTVIRRSKRYFRLVPSDLCVSFLGGRFGRDAAEVPRAATEHEELLLTLPALELAPFLGCRVLDVNHAWGLSAPVVTQRFRDVFEQMFPCEAEFLPRKCNDDSTHFVMLATCRLDIGAPTQRFPRNERGMSTYPMLVVDRERLPVDVRVFRVADDALRNCIVSTETLQALKDAGLTGVMGVPLLAVDEGGVE